MRCLFLCIPLFLVSEGFSQISTVDTAFVKAARRYKISLFEKDIKEQSRLYNGTEHLDYLSHHGEHPYYGIDDWSFGDVVYDDELYHHVPLFYDLRLDRIVTEHPLSGSKIELISKKVSGFSINGHQFVRLMQDEGKVIGEAFYEQLYHGKTSVYARREKFLHEKVEFKEIVASFEEKTRIYIYKDGIYHHVKSKGSVLDVFRDHQQEMKALLKKKNIRFKTSREIAIAGMAEGYDALTK